MSTAQETRSPSSTSTQSSDALSLWGTNTAPPHRPWRAITSMVAGPVMAGMMLASQGTTVLAETSKDTVKIVANADQSNGHGQVRIERADPATMNKVTRQLNLSDFYILRDAPTVLSFVQRNPFLSDVLVASYYNARAKFGADTPVRLELFSSPVDIGHEHLRIMIRSRLSVDEAIDQLAELYEGWFGRVLPATRGKLLIDVKPV